MHRTCLALGAASIQRDEAALSGAYMQIPTVCEEYFTASLEYYDS